LFADIAVGPEMLPSDIVFLDDADKEARARESGMPAIQFIDGEKIEVELKRVCLKSIETRHFLIFDPYL
jgi:hypothetical protein